MATRRARGDNLPDPSKPSHRSYNSQHLGYGDDYEPNRPSKRKITDHQADRPSTHHDSHRSSYTYRPSQSSRASRPSKSSRATDTPTIHTKHERKTNRSTRIHSIRNLLSHDELLPHIKIEKERELASLIFDQQKDKLKAESSKMITRYHKVRFFERKKAERKLKQLTTLRETVSANEAGSGNGIEGDPSGEEDRVKAERTKQVRLKELSQQIRDAEVDLYYTIYSPLCEKYISIFADGGTQASRSTKAPKSFMPKGKQQKVLSNEQLTELEPLQAVTVGLTRLSDRSVKPPQWYEVEKIMFPAASEKPKGKRGGDAMDVDETAQETVKKNLYALRERKLSISLPRDATLVRGDSRRVAEARKATSLNQYKDNGKGEKRKRMGSAPGPEARGPKEAREAWMDEEGHIDSNDLDSPSDNDDEQGGRMRIGTDEDSESMESDGDGGFFQR